MRLLRASDGAGERTCVCVCVCVCVWPRATDLVDDEKSLCFSLPRSLSVFALRPALAYEHSCSF